jgi:TPR repeat protein
MRMLRPLVASSLLFACLLAQAAPDTAYNLGVDAYRVKDYTSARQHWAKAVEEGENFALNNLGFLLYEGLGGPPDQARAVELWSMAARRGNNESQWHLAQAFEKGKGVAQSLVDAYAWYRCAANNFAGAEEEDDDRTIAADARTSVLRLLGALPPDQLAAAEQLARDYIAKYPTKPET